MTVTINVKAGEFSEGIIVNPALASNEKGLQNIPGECGEVIFIEGLPYISLGKKEKLSLESIRRTGGYLVKWLHHFQIKNIGLTIDPILATGIAPLAAISALVEGLVLGHYKFDKYLKDQTKFDTNITMLLNGHTSISISDLESVVKNSMILAEGVNLARDLSHEPPNVINPATIASKAKQLAAEVGLKYSEISSDELDKMGAGAITAVGKGSTTPSRLIILELNPEIDEQPIVLIGKTLTMDTGGYSLKGTENIISMKYDKTGGMVVLGTMVSAARLGLKKKVIGILAAAENMISSHAYRPDDILTALNGKTIEIISTDAEGRLVLADALTYAERNYKPSAVIDLATLTGAVVVALGDQRAGLLSNNDNLSDALLRSGERTYERLWRLPLDEEYFDQIKGTDSDIKNSGGKKAGTIIGGMFLKQFITDDTPWAHLDIAGMMMAEKETPYCPKGGMGFGVRLLIDFLQN